MGLRLVNLPEVRSGHDWFLQKNERLLDDVARRGGDVALGHVQHHADFKRRTGQLQDTTDYRVVKLKSGRILRITNPKKYAPSIDTGARPHIIRPRNAKVLRFFSKKAGRVVFARFVRHPGNRPYKFLYNATDAAYRVMGQELRHGMTDLAKRF
jgi:hypothetical protein